MSKKVKPSDVFVPFAESSKGSCKESVEEIITNDWQEAKRKQKKRKIEKNTEGQNRRESDSKEEVESEVSMASEKEEPKKGKAFNFMRLYNRIKMIVTSEKPLDEKFRNF